MINCILEYLESSARKYPDKIYLSDEERAVTFQETEEIAKRIGSFLSKHHPARNKPVAVWIGRDVESVLMFLGVVYSGNFYVPLNRELPRNRIKTMLDTLQPEAVLGLAEDKEHMEGFSYLFFDFEEMSRSEEGTELLAAVRRDAIDTDPICGIYTSGTTGLPKCVVKSHRSIISMTEMFSDFFNLSNNDIFGNQVAFDFDMANKDIYNALRNGATLIIISKKLYTSPSDLVEYLNVNHVSVLFWASSALHVMHSLHAFKHKKLEYVKQVMYSGEPVSIKALRYWLDSIPQAVFWNLYGCTEMTGNCTCFKIPKDFTDEQVPLGETMPGVKLLLIGKEGNLVANGNIGEICITGATLSIGYYNNAEQTKEKFVQNPLNSVYPEIIYRTGDLARYNDTGQIIFCGRKDFQIKHMGYRIELGDIETAANALDMVGRTCCIYDREHKRIVLCYEAPEKIDKEVRDALKTKLPKYMVPGRYVQMQRFPENLHGKIDRKRLEQQYLSQ